MFVRHSFYYGGPHIILALSLPLPTDILSSLGGLLLPSFGARTTLRWSSRQHSYPGPGKLGEGFGSSLSMAEFRVCIPSPITHTMSPIQPYVIEDAPERLYLTRTPPDQLHPPSRTFTGDILAGVGSLKHSPYVAGELGHREMNNESANRSSIVDPSNRMLLPEE